MTPTGSMRFGAGQVSSPIRYGHPPEFAECTEKPVPNNLKLVSDGTVISAEAIGMHPWLKKPASVTAIARQLNKAFGFARGGPVRVRVPGYGWFLLGKEGWTTQNDDT